MITSPTRNFTGNRDIPQRRTPAQREASRRNGARSRGPVTAEGKAISAVNSMKHGLLARVFMPPGDARDHDKMFRRLRRQLNEEFNPCSFTDRFAVDLLAQDCLQLARARQMIENLQRPSGIGKQENEAHRQLQADRRGLKQIAVIIRQIDAGEPLACSCEAASRIAERVGMYIASVEQEATPTEDSIPEAEMNDIEREEDRQLKQQWAKLRPVKARLADHQHLSAVLAGLARGTPAVLKALGEVLGRLVAADRARLKEAEGAEREVQQACQLQVGKLANEPDRLMLLQRYAGSIDRAIRRRIAQLKRR